MQGQQVGAFPGIPGGECWASLTHAQGDASTHIHNLTQFMDAHTRKHAHTSTIHSQINA